MSEILNFTNSLYIMWAEPDEACYNYHLARICSRFKRDEPDEACYNYHLARICSRFKRDWGPDDVPPDVAQRIFEKASKYYPIMIINGGDLDGLLDDFALGESKGRTRIVKFWGTHPRIVVSTGATERRDSVAEFRAWRIPT